MVEDLETEIDSLKLDNEEKDIEILELKETVQRLEKEKKLMISAKEELSIKFKVNFIREPRDSTPYLKSRMRSLKTKGESKTRKSRTWRTMLAA